MAAPGRTREEAGADAAEALEVVVEARPAVAAALGPLLAVFGRVAGLGGRSARALAEEVVGLVGAVCRRPGPVRVRLDLRRRRLRVLLACDVGAGKTLRGVKPRRALPGLIVRRPGRRSMVLTFSGPFRKAALFVGAGALLAVSASGMAPGAPEAEAQPTAEVQAPPPAAPAPQPALPPPGEALEDEEAPGFEVAGGARIVWRAWSPELFRAAQDLDRPVVLFLTNPWNTLGSVMDANTFTDERVAGVLRELFIPVRVDVDRRPDIEERFSTGGLPGVAFMMPSGESLYLKSPRGSYVRAGSTYLTADEMYHYLRSIADYYRENRHLLDLRIADIVERFGRQENKLSAPLDSGVMETVVAALRETFDRTHGGWGLSPKSPDSQTLLLSWYLVRQRGNAEARDLGLRTVRAIWDSPLHDRVGGGVFRMARERDWSAPRYEKVLEVNARLLEAMAEGALATGDSWLSGAVREQADFLLTLFTHPDGGFKRAQGPGDIEATYFSLGRRARQRAGAPPVDPLRIVSWNAHAVSGLLRAYQAVGDERYRERALAAVEFLVSECSIGARGMAHFYDGRPQMAGLLVDQVAMARALLDAYQVEGHQRYLREAAELTAAVATFFRDKESPRFVDRVLDVRVPGALSRPDRDLVDNSEMAMVLQDLAALTGQETYADEARRILEAFADEVGAYGVYGAPLARASDRALRTPLRLVLSRGGQVEKARTLVRAAAAARHPWLIVDWIDGRVADRPGADEEAVLRARPGVAALLAGYGRRSEILRTPEDLQRALPGFAPEKLPEAPLRPAPVPAAPSREPQQDALPPAPGGGPRAPAP